MRYRVLLTGAAGMLGKDVAAALNQLQEWEVYNLVRAEAPFLVGRQVVADLADSSATVAAVQKVRPDCVVHCAALTSLEQCERDPELAYRINVASVRWLIDAASSLKRFVYISTDSVFDGQVGDYCETDRTCPLNYYAKTKLMGEKVALEAGNVSLILRTNLYGFHFQAGASLVEWALCNLSKGGAIRGFSDVYFNPLYTGQLAKLITQLIPRHEVAGTMNVGIAGRLSKFEFLQKLADTFGYDHDLIERVELASLPATVKRPLNTTLNCAQLRHIVGNLPTLSEGLAQLKKDYIVHSQRGVQQCVH